MQTTYDKHTRRSRSCESMAGEEVLLRLEAARRICDAVLGGEWLASTEALDGIDGLTAAARRHLVGAR